MSDEDLLAGDSVEGRPNGRGVAGERGFVERRRGSAVAVLL
jgi:hypothetical protein